MKDNKKAKKAEKVAREVFETPEVRKAIVDYLSRKPAVGELLLDYLDKHQCELAAEGIFKCAYCGKWFMEVPACPSFEMAAALHHCGPFCAECSKKPVIKDLLGLTITSMRLRDQRLRNERI